MIKRFLSVLLAVAIALTFVQIPVPVSVFAVGYAAYVVPHNNADGRYL